jgi:hypothetical protein
MNEMTTYTNVPCKLHTCTDKLEIIYLYPKLSSQWFSKSDNPDVLTLFHRHSVWMIKISVLVKVNGIRHYSFIELILPCFSRAYYLFAQGGFAPITCSPTAFRDTLGNL